MPVTLDTTMALGPRGEFTQVWQVRCDEGGPYERIYVYADTEADASRSAVDVFGWTVGDRVLCPKHGGRG